ncbi:hypothetical protein ABKS89_25115 [Pseudomonas sp. LABIM340]|uniref:hypothetical protein n=1 Tax=Pseudomonas sp. LABIM340 TaxID=3156585 RepID=UPI0032AF4580
MPEQALKAYQVGDYDIVAAYDEAGAIRVLLDQLGAADNHYGYTLGDVKLVSDAVLDNRQAYDQDEG